VVVVEEAFGEEAEAEAVAVVEARALLYRSNVISQGISWTKHGNLTLESDMLLCLAF